MSSMASISFKHKILKGPKPKEWGANYKKKERKKRKSNQQKEKKKRKKLLILPQIIRNLLTC